MKIIDFEAHFFTDEYVEYLRSRKEPPNFVTFDKGGQKEEVMCLAKGVWAPRTKNLEALLDLDQGRIEKMDAAGISVQVLSLAGPGCELFEPSEGTELARRSNDKLAEAIKRHPDRFLGFASLAPQDPDGAVKELERTVKELGFKGAKINSHVRGGEYLDEEKYWVIFEKAEKLGVPIYIHPRIPSPQMLKPYADYGYALAGAALGFGAETALHAMRLIMSGVFDRFTRLKIILGHLGEALPFWLDRLDRKYEFDLKVKLCRKPSEYIKNNFLMTFSGMFFTPAFICVYLALGADNILFASDYPFEPCEDATQFIEKVPICDIDKQKICYDNAHKLLGLI
jgi:2,3-dihydroxybenzoate decarboxylase